MARDPEKARERKRLVAVTALGRPLRPDETVHHRNEDKTDNRWSNLEVLTRSEHGRHHYVERGVDELGRFRPVDPRGGPVSAVTPPGERPDPVAIVAALICDDHEHNYTTDGRWSPVACPGCRRHTAELLTALTGAGWRIVRLEPDGLWSHPDHVRPFYEDETRPANCAELFRVVDEWT